MLISYGNGESDWIYENTEVIRKNQYSNGGQSHGSPIYYGKERIMLPFEVFLDRFEKIDYPGSQMAKSYKSFVRINSAPDIHEIYMNEPLKHQGYTLYQSSYQILPNGTAVSILSVNQDPGRFLKYLGSLIMCLGIILYTLSRSQRMKFFFQKRS